MTEVILSLVASVFLLAVIWQRWNYVRLRRLMAAGWTASASKGPAGWIYYSPDETQRYGVQGNLLSHAYVRHKERIAAGELPSFDPPSYQLGDFAKD